MNMSNQMLHKLIREEDGQGMVEYSLVLALVSVAAILTMTTLGTQVRDVFAKSTTALGSAK